MNPNRAPPITSTIGYGTDRRRASTLRPATATNSPAISSSASPIMHLARGLPSLGGSGIGWFDRADAYRHPRVPQSAGFRWRHVQRRVSHRVVSEVSPTDSGSPGRLLLRGTDPR